MSRMRPKFPWFLLAPYGGGTGILADCSVDSSILQDSSVSSDGIQDSAVTSIKIADSGVGTGDIADSAITYAKIQTVTGSRLLGRYDTTNGTVQEIKLGSNLTFDTNNDELDAAGAGAIGGANTEVQFNDGGALGGDSDFVFDKVNKTVVIGKAPTLNQYSILKGKLAFADQLPVLVTGTERVQFEDSDGNYSDWSFRVAGGGWGAVNFATSSGTLSVPTAITDSNPIGQINFFGHDNSTYKQASSIVVRGESLKIDGGIRPVGRNGVDVGIYGGNADTGTNLAGGDLYLGGGRGDSSGANGKIKLTVKNSNLNAVLDPSSIAATDKTFTFPNKTGTFLLTTDSLDSSNLADCAVSYQTIQNVASQRLLGRWDGVAGVVQEVSLSGELRFDSDNDWLEIVDCGITNALLKDSCVDSTKILDSAVSNANIADSAVDSSKLCDCAVSNQSLADSSVDSNKLQDCAVSYQSIQNVTAKRVLGRWDAANGVVQEIAVSGGLTLDSTNDVLTSDSVAANSLTVAGRTELATSAEINTATDTLRSLSPYYYAQSNYGTRIVQICVTDTTLATGDSQFHFFIPPELDSWDLVDADACVATASTSGRVTIQLRNVTDAADMLSAKICIDSGEKTSYTADTAVTIDTANDSVVTGNEIAIDIDSAGNAEGLNVIMQFRHRGA